MVSRAVLLAAMVGFPVWPMAAEVAGVALPERAQVAGTDLQLNGAGLRKRFFFQVYAIGLYLPRKTASADEAVRVPGAKRASLHMLRNVSAEQFAQALDDGIRANHGEAELQALAPRLKELTAIMAAVREAKKGMTIALDWTGAGTQVLIDGRPAGRAIEGEDFYRALLRIWIGPQPVQEDLKNALLGG